MCVPGDKVSQKKIRKGSRKRWYCLQTWRNNQPSPWKFGKQYQLCPPSLLHLNKAAFKSTSVLFFSLPLGFFYFYYQCLDALKDLGSVLPKLRPKKPTNRSLYLFRSGQNLHKLSTSNFNVMVKKGELNYFPAFSFQIFRKFILFVRKCLENYSSQKKNRYSITLYLKSMEYGDRRFP